MNIKDQLTQLKQELEPFGSKLIAVSKTKPIESIQEAYDCGQRDFGENKVQELATKFEQLAKDINWHMIGHLQRNKIKYIAPFVHLIHGVDSERLLVAIDKEAKKNHRIISCLIQMHIAEEATKFGFDESELSEFLDSDKLNHLENINIIGLMGMATNTQDLQQVKKEFGALKIFSEKLKSDYDFNNLNIEELSMGMSSDYKIALKSGSTMVRIGSTIFGARNYNP